MTETSKSRPVPKTDMRPNIEISHALNGRVKDYAAENDITTSEAYQRIIVAGLDELDSDSDTGGMVKDSEPVQEPADRHATDDGAPEELDEIVAGWEDDGRLDARRAAAKAALCVFYERGELGKSEAIAELLPEYAVDGQDDETWWRKNVRPVLQEVASYSKGSNAYVL